MTLHPVEMCRSQSLFDFTDSYLYDIGIHSLPTSVAKGSNPVTERSDCILGIGVNYKGTGGVCIMHRQKHSQQFTSIVCLRPRDTACNVVGGIGTPKDTRAGSSL